MNGIANASEPMTMAASTGRLHVPDDADFVENVLSNVLGRVTVKQGWMGSEQTLPSS